MIPEAAFFLTVDWCNKSNRGIFCDAKGHCFRKDTPHTALEIQKILGPFWIVLTPKSELFTTEQIGEFTSWHPLGEYSNQYGVALKTTEEKENHDS